MLVYQRVVGFDCPHDTLVDDDDDDGDGDGDDDDDHDDDDMIWYVSTTIGFSCYHQIISNGILWGTSVKAWFKIGISLEEV